MLNTPQSPSSDPFAGLDVLPVMPSVSPKAGTERDPFAGLDVLPVTPDVNNSGRINGVRVTDTHQRTWGDTALDVAKGVGKGVVNTGLGLAEMAYQHPGVRLASDAVQRAVSALTGSPFTPAGEMFAAARQDPALGKATNTPQRVGQTLEQVGEFFALPAGKGNLVRKAATQAVGSGALARAQGADLPGTGLTALGGAAGPLVAQGVTKAGAALKQSALTGVEKALGPTKERFKAMSERIAPEFLEKRIGGVFGKSRKALLSEAKSASTAAGRQIDAVLTNAKNAGQMVKVQPIIDTLDQAKSKFISPDTGKILDPRVVRQLDSLQAVVSDLGPDATVADLVAVRRVWDQVVSHVGGFQHRAPGAIGMPLKEQTEAWAKRKGANAIRELLAKQVPDLDEVNKAYRFWKSLDDILTQTVKRTAPQKPGLGKTILTAAGMAAGASSGEGPIDKAEKMFIYGAVANRLSATVRSPQWKLASANLKNELAKAIMTGAPGRVSAVLHRIMVGGTSQATSGR